MRAIDRYRFYLAASTPELSPNAARSLQVASSETNINTTCFCKTLLAILLFVASFSVRRLVWSAVAYARASSTTITLIWLIVLCVAIGLLAVLVVAVVVVVVDAGALLVR